MKIYNYVKMNSDGVVLEEESFEYVGEVSMCGGSGGKVADYSPPPAPVPVQEAKQSQGVSGSSSAAREAQRERAMKLKGVQSTILSNGEDDKEGKSLGSLGSSNSTNVKTLLGQ